MLSKVITHISLKTIQLFEETLVSLWGNISSWTKHIIVKVQMRIFQFYITHQVCGCLKARSIIHLNLVLKQIIFLIIDKYKSMLYGLLKDLKKQEHIINYSINLNNISNLLVYWILCQNWKKIRIVRYLLRGHCLNFMLTWLKLCWYQNINLISN